jgi:hypothetical protein
MRRVFFGSLVVGSLVAGNSAFANETAPSNEELLRRLTALENSNAKLEKENASLRSRERHREKGKQVALTEPNGRSLPVSAAASAPHSGIAAYASAPIPAAPFNWTGFYVGALSGYGWTQLTDSGPPGVPAFQPTGGFWGVQVGVNKQFASGWLIGAEFDAALARIEASSKGPNPFDPTEFLAATIKLNNLMTLRGRFGFAADQNLFYLTGGLAWSEIEISAGSGGGIGPPAQSGRAIRIRPCRVGPLVAVSNGRFGIIGLER